MVRSVNDSTNIKLRRKLKMMLVHFEDLTNVLTIISINEDFFIQLLTLTYSSVLFFIRTVLKTLNRTEFTS